MSSPKAIGSFIFRKNCMRILMRSGKSCEQLRRVRCLSRVAGIDFPLVHPPIRVHRDIDFPSSRLFHNVQTRHFLGRGDGEGGGVLSKVYEEKRILGYSPEQLFNVVSAVDLYHGFVPWCQQSEIVKHHPDGSFDAELEIGFKFFVESYVSHVELNKPKSIKTTVSESSLFDHLINVWEFNPGLTPGTCDLHFFVDFKFRSPLYRQVATMFFKEVVSRVVGSFNDRCCEIYGPGVPILENTF